MKAHMISNHLQASLLINQPQGMETTFRTLLDGWSAYASTTDKKSQCGVPASPQKLRLYPAPWGSGCSQLFEFEHLWLWLLCACHSLAPE